MTEIDYYEVKYLYNEARPNEKFRTQKHDTMRMALASAHFLDAKGDYTIIHIIPVYKEDT
jgi:hypothetical protein